MLQNTNYPRLRVKKISDEIRKRGWNWIGHMLRKERNGDCMVAMEWQPEGKRKSGTTKNHMEKNSGKRIQAREVDQLGRSQGRSARQG